MALTTGLRFGNITGLTWDQISMDMARAVLVQKGGRRHTVALPAPVLDVLRTIEPDAAQRSGAVFSIWQSTPRLRLPEVQVTRRRRPADQVGEAGVRYSRARHR